MKLQGHRGFPAEFPENTMLSLREAVLAGADGIEMDVRRSADGVYVLMHDETADRTTDGSGKIERLSFEKELRRLDAGAWRGEAFAGRDDTKVPALDEALGEFRGAGVELILHFKCPAREALPAVGLAKARGMLERTIFFGGIEFINDVKRFEPAARTMNDGMPGPDRYEAALRNAVRYGHEAVSVGPDATADMVERIKARGKSVHCSFLSGEYGERTRRLAALGVDMVLGNDVSRMRDAIRQAAGPNGGERE